MTAKSINNPDAHPCGAANSIPLSSETRKAVFAGSFNPFTVGHASIVERGLKLFDHIYIVVGVNADKPAADATERVAEIAALYNNDTRVDVLLWEGLMADIAAKLGCRFFLRGIRGVTDMEYEFNMADINRRISGIETVFLPALPELGAVSSSVVRELERYGCDTSPFIPKANKF